MHVLHTFSPASSIVQGTWLPSVAVPVFVQLRVYLLPHRLILLHSWHWCPVSMQWTGNASQPVPVIAWALGIRSIMHAPTLRSCVPFGSMHPFSRCLSVLVVVEERLLH